MVGTSPTMTEKAAFNTLGASLPTCPGMTASAHLIAWMRSQSALR